MTTYSVKQLADLAGISVRTLQYYDKIGLLRPAKRSDNGYRRYHREQLLKLQQILLYRELEISLKDINDIVNNPSFNILRALEQHKFFLQRRAKHIKILLQTVDKTIAEVKTKDAIMTDSEIYQGFTPPEI